MTTGWSPCSIGIAGPRAYASGTVEPGLDLGMVLARGAVDMADRIAEGSTQAPRLLDPDILLASCDGDAEVLGRVIAALRTQLPMELGEAHARCAAGDAPGLRERAHRLHGMISTASTAVAMVASELEDEAASNRLETSAVLLGRLDAMTNALLTSLAELSIDDLVASKR